MDQGSPSSVAPARDTVVLAPGWHTAVLVALYVAVATAGLCMPRATASELPIAGNRLVRAYLPLLVVQWSLLVYVSRVARPAGTLRALIGEPWRTRRRAAEDVGIALVAWLLLTAIEIAWAWSTSADSAPASVVALLPRTPMEQMAWIVVAASVGFCEEVVFRGYLRSQFAHLFGSATLAIVLQAALFGLAHAEQGLAAAVRNGLYGAGLGVIAQRRRSLLPCIACHVWTDLASGLFHV